jgi:hypothetical protein
MELLEPLVFDPLTELLHRAAEGDEATALGGGNAVPGKNVVTAALPIRRMDRCGSSLETANRSLRAPRWRTGWIPDGGDIP